MTARMFFEWANGVLFVRAFNVASRTEYEALRTVQHMVDDRLYELRMEEQRAQKSGQ